MSFELLNNTEVSKDYYHHFKMRKYQLREVKLLNQSHTASKYRRRIQTPAFLDRDQFSFLSTELWERHVRTVDQMKPKPPQR